MAKSEYLETLEKLQNALTQFDMSFGVSNRIFRLALVSEILDTVCLFEQLYDSWSEYLPYGEGPDADVDFAYWKNLSSWSTLLDSAKQNACIDDFPLDMGNGVTSDKIHGNRRKTYLKSVNNVLRHSKYAGKEPTSAFVKTVNSDKTHMISFGNMVFDALSSLLLVFSKIETLLSNPPQELFLNFYEMQYNRFCEEWFSYRTRIVEILHEDLSNKRKCNKFYALKDEVWKSLYESNFLDALKEGINRYDIDDYRKENPDTSKTEDEIREVLALAELVDGENRPYKEKVGKYIFEHRKSLSYADISTFFVYLDAVPDILSNIEKLKEENCDEIAAPQPVANDSTSEVGPVNSVVDAIKEQTELLKKIAEQPRTQINNTLELVQKKETNIDKNYGPNIENNGSLSLPEDYGAKVLPESDDDKQ